MPPPPPPNMDLFWLPHVCQSHTPMNYIFESATKTASYSEIQASENTYRASAYCQNIFASLFFVFHFPPFMVSLENSVCGFRIAGTAKKKMALLSTKESTQLPKAFELFVFFFHFFIQRGDILFLRKMGCSECGALYSREHSIFGSQVRIHFASIWMTFFGSTFLSSPIRKRANKTIRLDAPIYALLLTT